jgi:hypothetical protein
MGADGVGLVATGVDVGKIEVDVIVGGIGVGEDLDALQAVINNKTNSTLIIHKIGLL